MPHLIKQFTAIIWTRYKLALIIFFAAFFLRVLIIQLSPNYSNDIDLSININSGQLVSNGINPYDFNDNKALRETLRTDSVAYDSYISKDQDTWNYYSSGNLPLSLLVYGAIDSISTGDAYFYRVVFALFDSALCVFIALFIRRYWDQKLSTAKVWGLALGLGALNPVLLYWGAYHPEDKGIEILLMLSSVYFALSSSWLLAATLLGMSVAFKGIGVFVAPIVRAIVLRNIPTRRERIVTAIRVSTVALLTCIIFFIPFLPGVLDMMRIRLSVGVSAQAIRASIWRVLGGYSAQVKDAIVILFLGLNIYGLKRKFINIELVAVSILIIFTVLLLNNESLDRLNMALLFSFIYVALALLNYALMLFYPINDNEFQDSIFALFMFLFFVAVLIDSMTTKSMKCKSGKLCADVGR